MAARLTPASLLASLALLLGIGLFAAGCRGRGGRSSRPLPARRGAAEEAYLLGRFDRARDLFGTIRRERPRSPEGREAAYWEGQCLLEMGRPREADALFRDAGEAKDPALAARALRGRARARFVEKRYREAERFYVRLRRRYPEHIDAAEILAALIACREKRGDVSGAASYRNELHARHGASPFARNLPESSAPRASGGQRYAVQAGAFRSRTRAERLRADLRRKGIETILAPRREGGATLYAVQAGVFSTPDRAESLARRIREAGFEATVR